MCVKANSVCLSTQRAGFHKASLTSAIDQVRKEPRYANEGAAEVNWVAQEELKLRREAMKNVDKSASEAKWSAGARQAHTGLLTEAKTWSHPWWVRSRGYKKSGESQKGGGTHIG